MLVGAERGPTATCIGRSVSNRLDTAKLRPGRAVSKVSEVRFTIPIQSRLFQKPELEEHEGMKDMKGSDGVAVSYDRKRQRQMIEKAPEVESCALDPVGRVAT